MPTTLLGRAAGAASSIIAAIAGEEQPAAAVVEASVGQDFHHSSVASADGSESEVGEQREERFPSANSSESEDSELSVESFPRDDEIALVPVHPMIDNGLFEKIWFCQPNNMTDDEKKHTNEQILAMGIREIRLLCKKCEYFESGKNKSKKVSTSGTVPAMKSKLLAWYHIFRQEQAGGNERAFSFSASWTPSQDARLLEIMSSPTYQNQLRFIHQAAPRDVLDAADGSPMVSVWRLVVAVLYNNFGAYQPPYRFPHDLTLQVFNPNNKRIPRRTPELLKNRYAALRSLLTVKYRQSTRTGQNEPQEDEFERELDLGNPLHQSVLYWWKIMDANGDAAILQRQVKLIPGGAGIDTSDPQSISRSLAAASTTLHTRMGNDSGGTGKGGSTTHQLFKVLDCLEAEMKASDDKENTYWEHPNPNPNPQTPRCCWTPVTRHRKSWRGLEMRSEDWSKTTKSARG